MLRDKINGSVKKFSRVYNLSFEIKEGNVFASLKFLMDAISESKNPRLFVLIDEYDRFANKLMLENIAAYDGVVTGVSGDLGVSEGEEKEKEEKRSDGKRKRRVKDESRLPVLLFQLPSRSLKTLLS
jgi:hypothetical protein